VRPTLDRMSLRSEIAEQPRVIGRLIELGWPEARTLARPLAAAEHLTIAARGSSDNAATYGKYLFESLAGLVTASAAPSLVTRYRAGPSFAGGAVVGISQSGSSPDVAAVVADARHAGAFTLAITNGARSKLARSAGATLLLRCGPERAVAATKTYLNSLGAVALLFSAIGGDDVARAELERMPDVLAEQIELSFARTAALDEYADGPGATVVARGVNYSTAHEIALKIRELSGLVVEAYSPADLMHGPIAAIRARWPVVAIAPTGPSHASVAETLPALEQRGARLVVVSDVPELLARARTPLPLVPGVPEWLSPLTAVIPGQVTAMRLAELRGVDVDAPLGLRKVTLTR